MSALSLSGMLEGTPRGQRYKEEAWPTEDNRRFDCPRNQELRPLDGPESSGKHFSKGLFK